MELLGDPGEQPMQDPMDLPLSAPLPAPGRQDAFFIYPSDVPQPTPPQTILQSPFSLSSGSTVTDNGAANAADGGPALFAGDEDTYPCWPQDPMDVDYDPELATWVNSWGRSPSPAASQLASHVPGLADRARISQQDPLNPVAPSGDVASLFTTASMPASFAPFEMSDAGHVAGPDDLLFPDDETIVGVSSQPANFPEPARSTAAAAKPQALAADINDPATLDLYNELLLFSCSNRPADDKLTFCDCDAEKETILHRLAMKLKLSYSYDPVQQRACVWSSSSPAPATKALPIETRSHSHAQAGFVTEGSTCLGEPHSVSPPQYCHPRAEDNSFKRHAIASPMLLTASQQSTNALGVSMASMTTASPPVNSISADITSTPTIVFSGQRLGNGDDETDQDSPSLSDRLSTSWNIFHSGISSRRPRGRRGPLSAKSRKDIKDLEWAGGACWRCKILRRKCDPGVPCKNCPAPDLREDAPPWPLIGCRRGSLGDAMPPQVLCPKSRALLSSGSRQLGAALSSGNIVDNLTGAPPPGQPDPVSQCFREAEVQCLSDNKLVLDNPSLYLRSRVGSAAAEVFSQAIRNGRYRANESLNSTCQVQGKTTTYAELIASIVWDLADNSECLTLLEIESAESFMQLLETACVYEVEVGKSPMVILSIVCLRCCFDALRLNSAGLLGASLHASCQSDRCSIDCLRELATCVNSYIEELSLLLFRKVNLRDRRWWLSIFYSLCIQAYVRRALLVVEQQLLFPGVDDPDPDVLCSSQYLHLVTVLFIAVSFQYDPLVASNGGLRLQKSLREEEGSAVDQSVPDRYFAAGRKACATDSWLDEGIKSSYQFLTRLLNISSLDFHSGRAEQGEMPMEESDAVLPLRRLTGLARDAFSGYSTNNSSTTSFASSLSAPRSGGLTSPPSSCGPLSSQSSPRTSLLVSDRRASIGSLPSRLSVASFSTASSDVHAGRLQLALKPAQRSVVHGGKQPTTQPAEASEGGSKSHKNSTGLIVCGCCLKRPQRFDTMDELKAHEATKPHICAFCRRRFRRMNEAERHITTIHLRPVSWSCGRLTVPLSAYQRASDGTAAYDVCGFCGRQFPRPLGDGGEESHAERLTAHVIVDHKIRECKVSWKKFYRQDMFGQHLKFSHAAEPGIWLKFIENTCKADEKDGAA